jgi:hypothetical protein
VQYLNGNISRRKDTLDTALFHELNHALHCATGDLKDKNTAILDYVYGLDEVKFWWTDREKPNDEELYNIVGAFLRDGKLHINPISCNMYDAFNSYKNGKKLDDIPQRMFHYSYNKFRRKRKLVESIEIIKINLDNFFVDAVP